MTETVKKSPIIKPEDIPVLQNQLISGHGCPLLQLFDGTSDRYFTENGKPAFKSTEETVCEAVMDNTQEPPDEVYAEPCLACSLRRQVVHNSSSKVLTP